MNIRRLTWITLATLALTACTSEDMERQTVADGTVRFAPEMVNDWNAPWTTRAMVNSETTVQQLTEGLYLQTNVQRGVQRKNNVTRGTKYIGIDDGDGNMTFATDGSEAFRVSGYRYASNSSVSSVTSANFLNNAVISYDHGEWKSTDQNYVMPASTDLIDFFGWFVTDEATAGVTAVDAAGGLQLTYEMPTTIANQPDLLAAVTRSQTYSYATSTKVPMQFTHQLTSVNFVLDENVAPGTISNIALMNVYTKGTLAFDVQNGTAGTWTLINAPTETAYDVNVPTVVNGDLQKGQVILGGLMMIPQVFNHEGQQIRIRMTVDNEEKTLYADLVGSEWEANTTVTYKVSTSAVNVLRISGLTYPTSWSAASTENSDIKSAYTDGDEIGVFGVDETGHVFFANKKYTLNGTDWIPDESAKSLYVPGATFYAYYPYQATLSGAPVESSETTILVNNALPTAAQFFSSVVTNWTPAENQSTAALLNAQDLQIGKSTTGAVSTVSFAMEHTMGLASVTMASVQVPNVCYFNSDETVNGRTTEKTTVTTSDDFTGTNQPCEISGKHYFVVKPSTNVTFSASSTSILDEWTDDITANVASAGYEDYTPENPVITRNYIYRGWVYAYTGSSQTFTVPADGTYTFECWGAQGGDATRQYNFGPDTKGGKGGYTRGTITLSKDASLYVYVGQEGGLDNTSSTLTFNGGGGGVYFEESLSSSATRGGGATDIRLAQSSETDGWSGASLDTRIMIAGGGGGSSYWSTLTDETSIVGNATGGGGGGINGCNGHISYRTTKYTSSEVISYGGPAGGGTQTSGGAKATWDGAVMTTEGVAGSYGQGATGVNSYGAGGGGGYYGGSSGAAINGLVTSAGGGSSFVSGATGCTAISTYRNPNNATQIRYNNVNYAFTSIVIINGESNIVPQTASFSLDDTETGHSGNGYARITSQVVE